MTSERLELAGSRPVERGVSLPLWRYWNGIGLATILILTAVLDFINLYKEGYGNSYYAAAVRSMTENWHAFFFNSLDPAGFVTIDKPPLGFWLQVVSVKLFGFNGVALMLPQALAGVLSVGLLYYLVTRIFGKVAGLVAALALALTPISVVANRNNIVDSTLVFVVLLGAWAVTRAVETGRLRWLVLCAVFVGLGFNIKMLQAFLVLPAFGLMYLLGAQTGWLRRLLHLIAATAVLLAISLSWVMAVDLTPAGQRPWVGSTTTNSALDLAVGYNGLQRLTGQAAPGNRRFGQALPRSTAGSPPPGAPQGFPNRGGGPGGVEENGNTGPLRLLNEQLGPQVGWLLPLAVIGFAAAAWQTRRRSLRLDGKQSALLMWGMWLVTMAVFFSIAGFFHTYYLVMVAPAIAALSGIGIAALWSLYLDAGSRLWWLLPAGLIAGAGIQIHLVTPYASWSRWLTPLIAFACAVSVAVLALVRLGSSLSRGLAVAATALGALVLLAAPTTWSVTSVQAASTGLTPRAGPANAPGGFGRFGPAGAPRILNGNTELQIQGSGNPPNGGGVPQGSPGSQPGGPGPGTVPGGNAPPGFGRGGFGPPSGMRGPGGGGPDGGRVNQQLLRFLEQHQGKATYLFATTNAGTAEPYIIATGKPVMAMGGFTGSDPILSPVKLRNLVKQGVVRYFMLGGGGFDRGGGASSWVQQHCTVVPTSRYSSHAVSSISGDDFNQQLYDCAGAR